MSDYITNSKNRKLKKRILGFLTRIGFGAGKLPISGRFILIFDALLFITLLFPWIELRFSDNSIRTYSAFSSYFGYVGYGILIGCILIPFVLLSHHKKERIRARIPFRLSDTEAVVFITSMICVSLVQILLISGNYNQIALGGIQFRSGFLFALAFTVLMIVLGYFLSKKNRSMNTDLYYLDHEQHDTLGEYRDILDISSEKSEEKKKKGNMSLPI